MNTEKSTRISNGVKKPHVIIFSGYGFNTEDETKAVFEQVGASADIIHLNDVIARPAVLKEAQIVIFPGGFSYGDDTGSGKAYGNRVRSSLGEHLEKFLSRDTLMAGICNGFQVVTAAQVLPGALVANDRARYLCRWVDLKVVGESPWLAGLDRFSVPIAHGEGKYYAPAATLAQLKDDGAIALKYVKGDVCEALGLAANPNGAMEDIAGVTGYGGRVLGLMPHPERATRFTQLPHWTLMREQYVREGKDLPSEGPGLQLFRNAVQYFV